MGALKLFFSSFLDYETPKVVQVKNKVVGVLGRILQLLIIAYIIGYVIIFQKGYQDFSPIQSAVTSKLKGIVETNFSDDQIKVSNPSLYRRIWDVADYVVPAQENGAFFVATNLLITSNQTQTTCPEDPAIRGASCHPTNNTCAKGTIAFNGNGNGVMTGNCIEGTNSKGVKKHSCEIKGWCPVEENILPLGEKIALLYGTKECTVLIKSNVEFPLFSVRKRNIEDGLNQSYLANCLFDKKEHPKCPIFKLSTIVEETGNKYDELAVQGGVVAITINWDCNLDFDEKYCFPEYTFTRLDDPDAKIARGWNFRYARFYSDNSRTLYKAYGIRFVVLVEGRAGKFGVIPFFTNIAAGLALMAFVSIICDFLVLYVITERRECQETKFHPVGEKDQFGSTATGSTAMGTYPVFPIGQMRT